MTASFLSRNDVLALGVDLDIEALLRDVLVEMAHNQSGQQVRREMVPKGLGGLLGMMPSYSAGSDPAFAMKVVCVMPGNPQRGLPAHQGVAMLFDGEDGRLLGMAEAGSLTELRTAAMAAVATRILARRDHGQTSLVLGAGHQALPHISALARLSSVGRHQVWARRIDAARRLSQEASAAGISVELVEDLEQAVRQADVVTLVTGAASPVIEAHWLKPGAHVNAMGSSTHRVREFGPDLLDRATIYVDHINSVLELAGEFVGFEDTNRVRSICDVLISQDEGRPSADAVTLFKSVGMALQDLALLRGLLPMARARGVGQQLAL